MIEEFLSATNELLLLFGPALYPEYLDFSILLRGESIIYVLATGDEGSETLIRGGIRRKANKPWIGLD